MTPETLEIYQKYRYFLFVLDNGRHPLFYLDGETLDYEKFFESYNHVIYMHWKIKPVWKNYKRRRTEIINKFQYNRMEILLRPHFCTDIKNVILTFLY